MAKPELLLVQLDNVHDSSGSSLVILGLGNGRGSDDVVPGLELRIGKLVGESSCREGYISDKFLFFAGTSKTTFNSAYHRIEFR